jgi:hypothetical protein
MYDTASNITRYAVLDIVYQLGNVAATVGGTLAFAIS